MDKNRILIALSESKRTDFGKKVFHKQSKAQKVFSTIWSLESEINNGGFSQYFINSSAETAAYAIESLQAIGATKMASICSDAFKVAFPEGLPSDQRKISEVATTFSKEILDSLKVFDNAFCQYPDNLTNLLFEYVLNNQSNFGKIEKPTDQ